MVKCDREGIGIVFGVRGLYSYFPRNFYPQVTSKREWNSFECSLSTSACPPTCIPAAIPPYLTRLGISSITHIDILML
jgi:hypothetical protein